MNDNKIRIQTEAAEWVLELENATNENFPLKAWKEWMSASDLHEETFKSMLNMWGLAKLLPEAASKPIN